MDDAALLEVRVRPRFVRRPRDVTADAKGDIELQCEVYAVPEATVQWYKNGDLIIESDYFQVVKSDNGFDDAWFFLLYPFKHMISNTVFYTSP